VKWNRRELWAQARTVGEHSISAGIRISVFVGKAVLWVAGAMAAGAALVILYHLSYWTVGALESREYKDWYAATDRAAKGDERGEIRALTGFLSEYPLSYYVQDVTRRLEGVVWSVVEKTNKETEYCHGEADLRPIPVTSDVENNLTYASYVAHFPNGNHVDEARRILEDACWDKAEKQDTDPRVITGHMEYLKAYPAGKHSSQAREMVGDRLVEEGEKARDADILLRAMTFLPMESSSWKEGKTAFDEIETWQAAVRVDTYEAFANHLKEWPNGLFQIDAARMLEYHGTWRLRSIEDRAVSSVGENIRDPVEPEEVTASLTTQNDLDTAQSCARNPTFKELVDGMALATRYYDEYRRRFFFGFDAPYRDKAKNGTIAIFKAMPAQQVRTMVGVVWRKISLTGQQRRRLVRLANVALQHEKMFEAGFDKVAADILDRKWKPLRFDGWYDLRGFSRPEDECLSVGFDVFPLGITRALLDFWYLRTLEGTRPAAIAGFEAVVSAGDLDDARR